jgi:hypothetical protein
MGELQLQGRLSSLMHGRINYSARTVLQNNSPLLFVIIILIHLLLIAIALNTKFKQRDRSPFESIMQLVQLQPKETVYASEHEKPNIAFKRSAIYLKTPELSFKEIYNSELDLSLPQSNQLYQLPDEAAAQYADVFDPKLRKKLMDSRRFNISRKVENPTSWTEIDGRVFVDMGNGECLVSMTKVDWRERGTNWGVTRCGKTGSEKMMDNVTADLEARKHPLKAQ